jgi:hypothetical protein
MSGEILKAEERKSFVFSGIEPDSELQKEANLRIAQILAQAPPEAFSAGTVELSGVTSFARVHIHSPFKLFSAQAAGMTPRRALMRALDRLDDQVSRWRWGTDQTSSQSSTSPNPITGRTVSG